MNFHTGLRADDAGRLALHTMCYCGLLRRIGEPNLTWNNKSRRRGYIVGISFPLLLLLIVFLILIACMEEVYCRRTWLFLFLCVTSANADCVYIHTK